MKEIQLKHREEESDPCRTYHYFVSYMCRNEYNCYVFGNTELVTDKLISEFSEIKSIEKSLADLESKEIYVVLGYQLLDIKKVDPNVEC